MSPAVQTIATDLHETETLRDYSRRIRLCGTYAGRNVARAKAHAISVGGFLKHTQHGHWEVYR